MYNADMKKEEMENYIAEAIESLKTIKPLKIMLFGSTAKLNQNEYNDIDFLIVLNNNRIPATYEDKMELKLEVRKCLHTLNKKVPIDLLIYTIPEYEELKSINSSFYREIHKSGKIVYEKAG
jgi:predicted nucleotidyltransferase